MSSYYKKINGKNYDKAMLDIAGKSVKGKGDGRISLADSRNIVKQISDGGKVTDIEKRTLNYILENYTLTETALKHIEKSLSGFIEPEIKKDIKAIKTSLVNETVYESDKNVEINKRSNKILIMLIFILLAIFALFAFFKYFYKGSVSSNAVSDNKEETSAPSLGQTAVPETENSGTSAIVKEIESSQTKPLNENEYLVQEKDTLIKISEAHYGDYRKWEDIYKLNKGRISNPTILNTGQIILLPEKSENK